jgi:hypothetical protein
MMKLTIRKKSKSGPGVNDPSIVAQENGAAGGRSICDCLV